MASLLLGAGTVLAANPAANLDQCANGHPLSATACDANHAADWVNGNLGQSKATYFEGDSVAYRMRFANLATTGPDHAVIIEWDTTKGGKHALDYLTTYNRTVTTATPLAGVSPAVAGAPSTAAIPADPQVTKGPDGIANNGDDINPGIDGTPGTADDLNSCAGRPAADPRCTGVFTLWGGTITGVSSITYSNGSGFAGDKSARLTVSFHANVGNPVLAWGGHIAARQNWGANNSAVAISGSPYHMRLIDLDGAGGNQDRSLSADAVIFKGSITIIKDAVPNDPQDFSFAADGSLSPASFTLDDDSDPAHSNTQAFLGIQTFQTYHITETAVPHWTLSFETGYCSVSSPNGGSHSGDASTGILTINLAEGENVTCTFTNTHQTNTPTVSTTLSNLGPVAIGTTVHDSASLGSATTDAGGTITYGLYSDSSCSTLVANLTPDVNTFTDKTKIPDSKGYQFNSAGTFYFQATYSGDANNSGPVSSTCTSETLVVSPNTTGLVTQTNESTGGIGDTLTDDATLSGATSNAGGTISFYLFSPTQTCDDATPISGFTYSATGVPVTSNGTYHSTDNTAHTGSNVTTVAGTYTWVAVYTDGTNNVASHSSCGSEDVIISPNTPTVSTTLSNLGPVAIGTTVHDSASLGSATTDAGGTITYGLYSDSSCSTLVANLTPDVNTFTDKTKIPDSKGYQFNSAGTFYFQATYSGDANNSGPVSSTCTSETLVVSPNTPSISTGPSLQVQDAVTIGNLANVATYGNLTVKLVDGADCTGTTLFTKVWYGHNKPVGGDAFIGNGTYTTAWVTVSANATLRWCSAYEGDANNAARPFADDNEVVTVTFADAALWSALGIGFVGPMLLMNLWRRRRKADQN